MLSSAIGSTIFFFWIDLPRQNLMEWVMQIIGILLVVAYIIVVNLKREWVLRICGAIPQKIEVIYAIFR